MFPGRHGQIGARTETLGERPMVDSGRTLVVRGGTVIDGTGEGVLHDGTVIAHDGRITWVGPASDAPDIGGPYQEIDARGGTVLPGFLDVHVHMVLPGEGADPARAIDRAPPFGCCAVLPPPPSVARIRRSMPEEARSCPGSSTSMYTW